MVSELIRITVGLLHLENGYEPLVSLKGIILLKLNFKMDNWGVGTGDFPSHVEFFTIILSYWWVQHSWIVTDLSIACKGFARTVLVHGFDTDLA